MMKYKIFDLICFRIRLFQNLFDVFWHRCYRKTEYGLSIHLNIIFLSAALVKWILDSTSFTRKHLALCTIRTGYTRKDTAFSFHFTQNGSTGAIIEWDADYDD